MICTIKSATSPPRDSQHIQEAMSPTSNSGFLQANGSRGTPTMSAESSGAHSVQCKLTPGTMTPIAVRGAIRTRRRAVRPPAHLFGGLVRDGDEETKMRSA
jgi:hypothetical protein